MSNKKILNFILSYLGILTLGPGFISQGGGAGRNLTVKNSGISAGYLMVIFLVPVTWGILIFIHLILMFTLNFFFRNKSIRVSGHSNINPGNHKGINNFLGYFVMVLPPAFLISYLYGLEIFAENSVQAPSDVYGNTLLLTLMFIPVVALLAWLTTRAQIIISPGTVFVYYLTLFLTAFFFGLWDEGYQALLEKLQVSKNQNILFSYKTEIRWRTTVRMIMFLITFGFVYRYTYGQYKIKLQFRKLFGIAVFTLLAFFNTLLWTGETAYSLEGIRKFSWGSLNFNIYKASAIVNTVKFPDYYRTPATLYSLGEYEYQKGNRVAAKKYFQKIVKRYSSVTYHAELVAKTDKILLKLKPGKSGDPKHIKGPFSQDVSLDVPVVQYANYLSQDWYGTLSAVGHYLKGLPDLELKEKLLSIFSKENHSLPSIETLPVLIPQLNRLSVPSAPAFLNDTLLVESLKNGTVPLIYFNHTWVPIVGYDKLRDGFYYYDYTSNYSVMLRFKSNETIFPGSETGNVSKIADKNKSKHRKFIFREKIASHLLNIGGIGVLVGKTTLIEKKISDAAYLIELGDLYYQYQNNFLRAAQAYKRSRKLSDNWVVKERMAFLLKHHSNKNSVKGKISSLYKLDNRPGLHEVLGITAGLADSVEERVFSGRAGLAILQQWPAPNFYYQAEKLDSLHMVYSILHKEEPFNLEYIDSLASFEFKKKNYSESRTYYKKLNDSSPYGDEVAVLNMAWTHLIENDLVEVERWLPLASQTYYPAKFFTLQAALELKKNKLKKAYRTLKRSLKEDKTLYLTHDLLVDYFSRTGDSDKKQKHIIWSKRCRGLI